MRSPRLKLPNQPAVYHCICRVVGGAFLLHDQEKEQLRKLIRLMAEFCGIQIITYCLLSNHVHLLLRTPGGDPPTDEELLRRVRLLYGRKSRLVGIIEQDLAQRGAISPELRRNLLKRLGDLSMYMKELKQRFTRWFNRVHERFGTLWAERFNSVLVEDEPASVQKVAAYIDLNPVRAGLVTDPKDYRFCGYAEALGGGGKAREGLAAYLPGESWLQKMEHYRQYLFCRSGVSGHSEKQSLSSEEIRARLEKDGALDLSMILRLRVRYMTQGAVLGSRAFVEEMFGRFRKHFGKKRKDGARPMKGADWGGMMVLRGLRSDLFG
jgi:putative transposase